MVTKSNFISIKKRYTLDEKFLSKTDPKTGEIIIAQVSINEQGQLFLESFPVYTVKTATSCLIKPQNKDKVSAVFDGNLIYITHVLDREKHQEIILDCNDHPLNIVAKNIHFNVDNNIKFESKKIIIRVDESEWNSNLSKYIYDKVYIVSNTSYQNIKENSEVDSKNLFIKVKQTYSMKSKVGIIKTDAILKIDGTQVHMG